jgi:hypothetical protein
MVLNYGVRMGSGVSTMVWSNDCSRKNTEKIEKTVRVSCTIFQHAKKIKKTNISNFFEKTVRVCGSFFSTCERKKKKKNMRGLFSSQYFYKKIAACGVRTHASEDTATWTQRLRPLGQDCFAFFFFFLFIWHCTIEVRTWKKNKKKNKKKMFYPPWGSNPRPLA